MTGNVWGFSANNMYVVGWGNNASRTQMPLLYHYDGSEWTEAGLSLPDGRVKGSLAQVWGSSANNVYAIGSASDGLYSPSKSFPLLYHYDGTRWTESSPSLPDGWTEGYLMGIWGSSANDVYVVGRGVNAAGNSIPLIYHHNGTGWTEVSIPLPPVGYFSYLDAA